MPEKSSCLPFGELPEGALFSFTSLPGAPVYRKASYYHGILERPGNNGHPHPRSSVDVNFKVYQVDQ